MRITIGVLSVRGSYEPDENEHVIIQSAIRALGHAGYESILTRAADPQPDTLKAAILELCEHCEVVFTTGASGFGPTEIAPEVTTQLVQRQALGIPELIRTNLHKRMESSHLHRGIAGICDNTVIVNLPGSAEEVKESIETVSLLLRPMISSLKALEVVEDVH